MLAQGELAKLVQIETKRVSTIMAGRRDAEADQLGLLTGRDRDDSCRDARKGVARIVRYAALSRGSEVARKTEP